MEYGLYLIENVVVGSSWIQLVRVFSDVTDGQLRRGFKKQMNVSSDRVPVVPAKCVCRAFAALSAVVVWRKKYDYAFGSRLRDSWLITSGLTVLASEAGRIGGSVAGPNL